MQRFRNLIAAVGLSMAILKGAQAQNTEFPREVPGQTPATRVAPAPSAGPAGSPGSASHGASGQGSPSASLAEETKADIFNLPASRLRAWGIPDQKLLPTVVSRDGQVLVAIEHRVDPKVIAEGKAWVVHLIRLDWARHDATHQALVVPFASLEQTALSPDGRSLLAVGDWGTRFVAVNLQAMSCRTIFAHEEGKAGFRANPVVLWNSHDAFHVVGYFYDAQGYAHEDAVANVNLAGSGAAAFKRVRTITQQVKDTANFVMGQWFDDEEAYFAGLEPDHKVHLRGYLHDKVFPIDTALGYGGMAVGAGRVFYLPRYTKTEYDACVVDCATGQRWKLGDSKTIYSYPYISENGQTVLVSHFDLRQGRMSTWYGREKNNFRLKPVPTLTNCLPGTIRFSKQAEVLSYYNRDGLKLLRLPKD